MDKYARLMQKLEIVNVEFFKVSSTLHVPFFSLLSFFFLPSLCLLIHTYYESIFLIQYIVAGDMPVV